MKERHAGVDEEGPFPTLIATRARQVTKERQGKDIAETTAGDPIRDPVAHADAAERQIVRTASVSVSATAIETNEVNAGTEDDPGGTTAVRVRRK